MVVLTLLILLSTRTSVSCKQFKFNFCVLASRAVILFNGEGLHLQQHLSFLFLLHSKLFSRRVDFFNGENGNCHSGESISSERKFHLYSHKTYGNIQFRHLQKRERNTKALPYLNRDIAKFVERGKLYKHICLSKESDIISGPQSKHMVCVFLTWTSTEYLIKENRIPLQKQPTLESKNHLSALTMRETQIQTTIKRVYSENDVHEDVLPVCDIRKQFLKHVLLPIQTDKILIKCQRGILAKHITEADKKEALYLQSEKKASYSINHSMFQTIQVYPVQQYSLEQAFKFIGKEGSTATTDPEVCFSNYLMRLSSYRRFQNKQAPSAIKLSKAGFYATGNNDETACFHCGCRYSHWCENEDPIRIHTEISPECEFILELSTSEKCREERQHHITNGRVCSEDPDTTTRPQILGNSMIVFGNEQQRYRGCYPDFVEERTHHVDISLANSTEDEHKKHMFYEQNGHQQLSIQETERRNIRSLSNNFETISIDNIPSNVPVSVPEKSSPAALSSRKPGYEFTIVNGNCDLEVKENDSVPNGAIHQHELKKYLTENREEFARPSFPKYTSLLVRMSSFAKWPTHRTQTPKQMADAGFFYKGYSDVVVCFWCGVTICDWEDEDEPCMEHIKWQPNCPFTLQTKGKDFVNLVLEEPKWPIQENKSIEDYNVAEQTLPRNSNETMTYPKLKEMGFTEQQISDAVHTITRNRGDRNPTEDDILEQLLGMETAGQARANDTTPRTVNPLPTNVPAVSTTKYNYPVAVNNPDDEAHLRRVERLICKICMSEEVKVTFLPCGHLICCMDCSAMVSKCPVCREQITNRVKCYLS